MLGPCAPPAVARDDNAHIVGFPCALVRRALGLVPHRRRPLTLPALIAILFARRPSGPARRPPAGSFFGVFPATLRS
jgi:hypothetical protein